MRGFCIVSQFPVAMSMVDGVSGEPGLSAHFLVEADTSLGDASVITRLLRVVGGGALVSQSSRNSATHTFA